MSSVLLDPEAAAELRKAAHRSETVQPGLGRRFLDEVIQTRRALAEMPLRFPLLRDIPITFGVRRALCRSFPYALVFTIVDSNAIRILAVAHIRRQPNYWIDRLIHEE